MSHGSLDHVTGNRAGHSVTYVNYYTFTGCISGWAEELACGLHARKLAKPVAPHVASYFLYPLLAQVKQGFSMGRWHIDIQPWPTGLASSAAAVKSHRSTCSQLVGLINWTSCKRRWLINMHMSRHQHCHLHKIVMMAPCHQVEVARLSRVKTWPLYSWYGHHTVSMPNHEGLMLRAKACKLTRCLSAKLSVTFRLQAPDMWAKKPGESGG